MQRYIASLSRVSLISCIKGKGNGKGEFLFSHAIEFLGMLLALSYPSVNKIDILIYVVNNHSSRMYKQCKIF